MICSVSKLVSFASHVMTLFPCDIRATGTPAGVGPLNACDPIQDPIDPIGEMRLAVEGSY